MILSSYSEGDITLYSLPVVSKVFFAITDVKTSYNALTETLLLNKFI